MEDYKEIIAELFLRYYSPVGDPEDKKYLSTEEILSMVRGIVPHKPIGEHEIYEVMKDLKFMQELEVLYEKKYIFEGDEKKGIPPEYDMVESSRIFKWVVYENNH